MSSKNSQHYVPRFYLNAFRDHKHRFWVYSNSRETVAHTQNISRLCSQHRYYDSDLVDSFEGEQFTENLLSKIETLIARNVKNGVSIFASGGVPSQEEWRAIVQFITLQFWRTPRTAHVAKAALDAICTAVATDYLTRIGIAGATPKISVPVEHVPSLLLHGTDVLNSWPPELCKLSVLVLINKTEQPFITSDAVVSPLLQNNTGRAAFIGPNAGFIAPLSANVILMFYGCEFVPLHTNHSFKLAHVTDPDIVTELNVTTLLNSHQVAISNSNSFGPLLDHIARHGRVRTELKPLAYYFTAGNTSAHIAELIQSPVTATI